MCVKYLESLNCIPVTIVDPYTGMTKRVVGQVIAEYLLRISRLDGWEVIPVGIFDEKWKEFTENFADLLYRASREILPHYIGQYTIREVLEKLDGLEVRIRALNENTFLMDFTEECIRVDLSHLENIDVLDIVGLEVLYFLSIIHELYHLMKNEEEEALEKVIDLYENLRLDHRKKLHKVLESRFLDTYNNFSRFLKKSVEEKSRNKWLSWIISQVKRDYPYDVEKVRELMDKHGDRVYTTESQREMYEVIKNTYNESLERINLSNIIKEARERGELVVFMRLSRASILLGYLLAAAKKVKINDDMRNLVNRILEYVQELDVYDPQSYVSMLKRLCLKDEAPEAQLVRLEKLIMKSLSEHEKRIDEDLKKKLERGELSLEEILEERRRIISHINSIKSLLYQFIDMRGKAEKRDAVFVILGQRISPTGALRIALANELENVYAGPSYGLDELIIKGGHNIYTSPSLVALEYADYWIEALPLFIYELPEGGYEIDYEGLEVAIRRMAPHWALNIERALREGRRLPTLNIVTTQGYNMTNLIRYWLEEEMANFNLIRAYGLEDEVNRLVAEYQERIINYAERVIRELHLEQALELETKRTKSRERAIFNLLRKDPELAIEVGKVAIVEEYGLEEYVKRELERLEQKSEISRERRLIKARENVLKEFTIDPTSLKPVKGGGEVKLIELARRYIRDHLDLAESTARKEVIAKHGLSSELMKFRYEATGSQKKYNLAYTPSRVDLGPEEIASVIEQGQPIGPFDMEAGKVTKELYDLINISPEGAYILPNPACAEGQKTLENAFRDDNYAFANILALTAEAMGANAYSMISYINMRPTHLILWPGRGYGGFCIPKDGLFVSYVLSLKRRDILSKLGVPEHLHESILELVNELLDIRPLYEDISEWKEVVLERLGQYLTKISRIGTLPGSLEKIVDVMYSFKEGSDKWNNYLKEVAKELYEQRYIPSRIVNTFMPYFTAAHIYHALEIARKRNPRVHSESEARVGIQAAYKPGVQDSRMTTEFDVFLALTKSDERLKRIRWNFMKRLISQGLDHHDVPFEIRVIDPLIDADQWLFDSEITLKKGAEAVKEVLYEGGMSEDDIRSNIELYGSRIEEWIVDYDHEGRAIRIVERPIILAKMIRDVLEYYGIDAEKLEDRVKDYGLDFEKWPELRGISEISRLLWNKIRGKVHWLIIYTKGIEKDPEKGVEGLDVLSLGIPHPELVRLVYDLPRLNFLMRKGNPDSALALVDGTAGARGLVLNKDLVKEWLALGGTYVAIGISDDIIEIWRREMEEERDRAEKLLKSVLDKNYNRAQEILDTIVRSIDENILDEVRRLRKKQEIGIDMGLLEELSKRYEIMEKVLNRVYGGLDLRDLDFGTFLILGGRFVLESKVLEFEDYSEFADYVYRIRERFEEAVASVPEQQNRNPEYKGKLSREEVDRIIELFLLRKRAEREVEVVVGGALKGELKEEWEAVQRRLIRSRQRRALIIEKYSHLIRRKEFVEMYNEAKEVLGTPRESIDDETIAKYLAHVCYAIVELTREIKDETTAKDIEDFLERNILRLGGVTIKSHSEIIDFLSELAYEVSGDKDKLELIAMAAELVDIALAIELISSTVSWREVWTAVARFFDRTLNCHIFDYMPYLYTRASFSKDREYHDVFTRRELFELMARRHEWLYNYIREVLIKRTELKLLEPEDVEKLLTIGIDRDPIAIRDGYLEAAKLVLGYARLRDLATLYHDGFFIPEVLDDVDPNAIEHEKRVNIVILYNLGNTTAMAFLKRAPYHHRGKGLDKNIIMTNFMRIGKDPVSGREVAYVDYGLMYLTEDEYRKAGGKNKILKAITDPQLRKEYEKIGEEGRLVFIRFRKPILACAVFPHFTHPWFLDQTLEKLGIPLNQSRIIDRLTYKKTELPYMIEYYNRLVPPRDRIPFVDQVNILRDSIRELPPEERRGFVERVLIDFSRRHPKVIIKTSTESGGRGTITALLRKPDGSLNREDLIDEFGEVAFHSFDYAVDFILKEILPRDDAVVQEFIESRPRDILTEEALKIIEQRFKSLGITIGDTTPLYWNFRNYVTQLPYGEPKIVGWIMLVHVKTIANYGRGGQLFLFERNMLKPEYHYIFDEMERISKATMKILELYAPIFARKERIAIRSSLAGYPYTIPMTNLSDLMLKPLYDESGRIVKWQVVPIEENIGMGLFYQYERELEKRNRAGESVDPILINLAIVGEKYLRTLRRWSIKKKNLQN